MSLKKISIFMFCLLSMQHVALAQFVNKAAFFESKNYKVQKESIIPGGLILGGSLLVMTHSPIHSFNTNISNQVQKSFPGFRVKVDDWLQYVPGGGALGLGFTGVSGKHALGNRFVRYAIATAIGTSTVHALKKWTHVLRPDGTTYNSFPSGHTATAFTGAEMLHQEYGDVSVWYSVIGYSLASATGLLRMLNNRHSLGDVLGGAGIGMASVKFSYWLTDHIKRKRKPAVLLTF
ncbi:MAG: phosphatase PAP2 family protein [Chitinophagaceae bacterium]